MSRVIANSRTTTGKRPDHIIEPPPVWNSKTLTKIEYVGLHNLDVVHVDRESSI